MKVTKILINSVGAIALTVGGYFIGIKMSKNKTVYAGTLWVDESEPNTQPGLYLELNTDVKEVAKAEVVKFKISRNK